MADYSEAELQRGVPVATRVPPGLNTELSPTKEAPRDHLLFSFNITGVVGRPVVSFAFETQAQAEAARNAMQPIVAKAKLITPHTA